MKLLAVHPSGLMYTRIFLRLEPLGLELICAAARDAGHDVRLIDLQVETHRDLERLVRTWRPDAVCFSGNYLANIPEIVDLAKAIDARLPECFVFVGGHSASFIAADLLRHADGAVDCVLKGEGEASVAALLAAVASGESLLKVSGVITRDGNGPPPHFVESLDRIRPARDLLRHRRKYFIGTLDPCASIEFARGCPWDCTFCSAWTFYGRSYRTASPEVIAEELAQIREPGVFIVDDVAFVHAEHGMQIGEALQRRGILRKKFYLETRADVLLRNKEVFRLWRRLGLEYIFIGLEAIDEAGLKKFRKRVNVDKNFEALEFARSLGITVAINLIGGPAVVPGNPGDRQHQRQHALSRHGDLAAGATRTHQPGLPLVRHPARGASDPAAAAGILRRTGAHAAGAQPEASGLGGIARGRDRGRSASATETDQLRSDAVEVQFRVRPAIAARGP
jgi:hopanoid C-3 methylase